MENKKQLEELIREMQEENSEEIDVLVENAKKEKSKAMIISIIASIIIDVIILCLCISIKLQISLFVIVAFLITDICIFVITNIFFGKNKMEYEKRFKEIVINKLMSNFYDGVEYYPDKEMPKSIYEEGHYEMFDEYISEDYLEARIEDKYNIDMAEVCTKKIEKYRDNEGHVQERETVIFNGLFAKIVNHKSINCEMRINPDSLLKFNRNSRIELDSSEFEKKFDVFGTNKIIAMQILTPDIMETLVEFKNTAKIDFDIYLHSNEIYIRFHCGEVFEAPSLRKGMFDESTLRLYYKILDFTYTLSDKLIKVINDVEI